MTARELGRPKLDEWLALTMLVVQRRAVLEERRVQAAGSRSSAPWT